MTDPQNPPNDDAPPPETKGHPSTTEELVRELRARVAELEGAFHAYMSHLGAGHPAVVSWVQKAKERIAALL